MKKQTLNNVVNISSLDIPELMVAIRRKGKVMGVLGAPGIGKTAGYKYAAKLEAKKLKLNFVENPRPSDWTARDDNGNYINFCYQTVIISQMDEIDTRGLPHIVTNQHGETQTRYSVTELFPQEGIGMTVLDEFGNGRTSVQNAIQEILLEHKVGNHRVSLGINFVIASNRSCDNSGTHYIPAALRNRVVWFEVNRPNKEDWIDLMERIEQPIDARMTGWLLSIGGKYYDNFDPQAEQYAYGTNRSLHSASDLIGGVDDYKLMSRLVGGAIGEDAGIDFVSFLKLTEKVDINELLKTPSKIHEYEENLGLLYSISVTLIDKFIDTTSTNEPILSIIMETKRKEHGMFILKNIMTRVGKAKFIERLTKCKNAREVTAKYYQLLRGEEEGQ